MSDYVPEKMYRIPIGKAKIIRIGTDITIVGNSYMAIEAIKAAKTLEKIGISAEVVDVRTIKPLDKDLIIDSVKKTNRLLVADSGWKTGGIAAEIIAQVMENINNNLLYSPQRITLPDAPTPSSPGLTEYYYPISIDIVKKALTMIGIDKNRKDVENILKSDSR